MNILKNFLKPKKLAIHIENNSYKVLNTWFWNEFNKGWEINTFNIYKKYIKGLKYIDIGAYIGPAIFYASYAGASYIYAIEANPFTFKILKRNLQFNKKKLPPYQLFNLCVTSKDNQLIEFISKAKDSTAANMMGIGNSNVRWNINSIRFDTFIKKIKVNGNAFIKIDIEGAESIIIEEIKRLSNYENIYVLLSLHPPFWKHKIEITKKILDLYNYYEITTVKNSHLNQKDLENMLSSNETYPKWGTKWGNFFEILLKK